MKQRTTISIILVQNTNIDKKKFVTKI